jgi:hypothetical protein
MLEKMAADFGISFTKDAAAHGEIVSLLSLPAH